MQEEEIFLPLATIEDIKQKLALFLDRHPFSSVESHELNPNDIVHRIENIWGDSTLTTLIPENDEAFFDALNGVYLPERLSAIWHQDSKDLEVIWTAYELEDSQKEIANRRFTFSYQKKKYVCEFYASSKALSHIAAYTYPKTNPTSTNFRNLQSFNSFATREEGENDEFFDQPRSFWIRDVKLDEKSLLRMIESLNFYMTYYDARSPRVMIHDVHGKPNAQTRYCLGSFPEKISGNEIDEVILGFWDAARQPNVMMKFIHFYRIIEYAAFHYLDAGVKQRLRKILADPAICHDVNKAMESVISIVDPFKTDDVPRFNSLLTTHVDAKLLWREIENNLDVFSKHFTFDGGYVLKAIVSQDETESTFTTGGVGKFGHAIRQIRNALVHGRDQGTAGAISPTPRNMMQLAAWVNAIAVAAGQVVIYETIS